MARVRAAALGAALLEAALGQCPTFGRRNYYAEHCEIITYDAASGFAYAWLNAGPCVAGFAAATDADVVAVWPEGADPPHKRNGPRRFMTTCVGFDDAAAVAARAAEPFRLANPARALGGVEYAVQARLPFESAAAFEGWGDGGLAYEGVLVNRSAVMVWEAGSTVFELVDAAGKRYVMQSLSQIVVENLAPSDLEALPRDLPEGWSFRSRTASRGRDDFRELLLIGNLETHLEYENSYSQRGPGAAPRPARPAAPRRYDDDVDGRRHALRCAGPRAGDVAARVGAARTSARFACGAPAPATCAFVEAELGCACAGCRCGGANATARERDERDGRARRAPGGARRGPAAAVGARVVAQAAPAPAPAPTAAPAPLPTARAARAAPAAARRPPTAAPTAAPAQADGRADAAPSERSADDGRPTTPARPTRVSPPTSSPRPSRTTARRRPRLRVRAPRLRRAVAATDAPPAAAAGGGDDDGGADAASAAVPVSVFVAFALGAAALHVRAARRGRAREAELAEMDKDGGLWSDRDEERKESDDVMDLRYTDA
ncbi:hypothetical protein JL721_11382 [Aureococcus anophagefferens]|nr:hypothetical protein JL721_11382 [Aureococcus anophagefferens]